MIKFTYTSFLVLGFLFISCKKYPEDGKRSWHKPQARLTNGIWILKEFLVDGQDSTYNWYTYYNVSLNDTLQWQLYNMSYYFQIADPKSTDYNKTIASEYDIKHFKYSHTLTPNGTTFKEKGDWHFVNNKKQISINTKKTNINPSFSIVGSSVENLWNIQKLTDEEFIIETRNVMDKNLRLKFQK